MDTITKATNTSSKENPSAPPNSLGKVSFWRIIIFIYLGLIVIGRAGFAATFIPVGSPLYQSFSFLEAAGCLKSALLSLRPLSRLEALRLKEEAQLVCPLKGPVYQEHLKRIAQILEYTPHLSYWRPVDEISGHFLSVDLDDPKFKKRFYHRAGEALKHGLNYRFSLTSRAEGEKVSFLIKASLEETGNGKRFFYPEFYFNFSGRHISLLIGRLSQKWGPGEEDLILSDTPYPFDLLWLTNETPWLWGGWLVRGAFFVTKLEDNRAIPEPYLWGARLVLKPRPWLEMGLSRSALLGGEGRPKGLKTWLKSFLGKGENLGNPESELGDQRFSLDFKITKKAKGVPFQFYVEIGREHLVEKILYEWGYLIGLYLPTLGPNACLSFRLEYTHTPSNWGVHYLYQSGYTYRGFPIGHHLFKKGHNWWGKLTYQLLPLRAEFSLNFETSESQVLGEEERYGFNLTFFSKKGPFSLKGERFYFRTAERRETGFWGGVTFSLRW